TQPRTRATSAEVRGRRRMIMGVLSISNAGIAEAMWGEPCLMSRNGDTLIGQHPTGRNEFFRRLDAPKNTGRVGWQKIDHPPVGFDGMDLDPQITAFFHFARQISPLETTSHARA